MSYLKHYIRLQGKCEIHVKNGKIFLPHIKMIKIFERLNQYNMGYIGLIWCLYPLENCGCNKL